MKSNNVFFLVSLITLSFLISSCSKKDGAPPPPRIDISETIIGKWQATGLEVQVRTRQPEKNAQVKEMIQSKFNDNAVYEFTNNGKCTINAASVKNYTTNIDQVQIDYMPFTGTIDNGVLNLNMDTNACMAVAKHLLQLPEYGGYSEFQAAGLSTAIMEASVKVTLVKIPAAE